MNVEICISKVGSIKYFFKHVCKGHDRITVEVVGRDTDYTGGKTTEGVPTIDEIRHYQDARHISASEAARILLSFRIEEHEPTVERLEFHLEGHHIV